MIIPISHSKKRMIVTLLCTVDQDSYCITICSLFYYLIEESTRVSKKQDRKQANR